MSSISPHGSCCSRKWRKRRIVVSSGAAATPRPTPAKQDRPPVMCNKEEAAQHAKSDHRHGEEVHCSDCFTMIAQEGRPSLCRLRTTRRFPHPAQLGSLGKIETTHLQLAVNARCAPDWTFRNHAEDQFTQSPADAFSSSADPMPGNSHPVELEPSLVSANLRRVGSIDTRHKFSETDRREGSFLINGQVYDLLYQLSRRIAATLSSNHNTGTED